jgi:hypothetical protein
VIIDEQRPWTLLRARNSIAVGYLAVVALVALSWSIGQIDEQLRMQPDAGECGGVLVSAVGSGRGEARSCVLVWPRAAGLVATASVLMLPLFLVASVLFIPLGRALSPWRLTLFTTLALSLATASLPIAAALQGEFCRYDRGTFAPWSAYGLPCWPEWGYLAGHWAAFAFLSTLVLGLPVLLTAVLLSRRCQRKKCSPNVTPGQAA